MNVNYRIAPFSILLVDIQVRIVTTLRAGRPSKRNSGLSSSPQRPDPLWAPPSLLSNFYQGSFLVVKVSMVWR